MSRKALSRANELNSTINVLSNNNRIINAALAEGIGIRDRNLEAEIEFRIINSLESIYLKIDKNSFKTMLLIIKGLNDHQLSEAEKEFNKIFAQDERF